MQSKSNVDINIETIIKTIINTRNPRRVIQIINVLDERLKDSNISETNIKSFWSDLYNGLDDIETVKHRRRIIKGQGASTLSTIIRIAKEAVKEKERTSGR